MAHAHPAGIPGGAAGAPAPVQPAKRARLGAINMGEFDACTQIVHIVNESLLHSADKIHPERLGGVPFFSTSVDDLPNDFFRTHPIMVVPHYVDIVLDAVGVETITPFHDRPHVASSPFLGGNPAVAYLDAGELLKLGCYAVEVLGFRVAPDHSFLVKGKFIMFLEASNFVADTSIPLLDVKFLPLDTVFEFTLGEQVLRPKPNLLSLLLASSPIEEVSARPPITEIQKRNKMLTTDGTHEIIFVQTAIAIKELAESLPTRRLYGTNPQFEKIVGPYGYHVTAAKVRSVMIDDSRENTVTGRDLLHSLQGLEFWKTDEALEKFLHASFETETGGFSLSWFVDKRLVCQISIGFTLRRIWSWGW